MNRAILSLASAAIIERGVSDRISGSPTVPSFMTLVFMTLIRAAAID